MGESKENKKRKKLKRIVQGTKLGNVKPSKRMDPATLDTLVRQAVEQGEVTITKLPQSTKMPDMRRRGRGG